MVGTSARSSISSEERSRLFLESADFLDVGIFSSSAEVTAKPDWSPRGTLDWDLGSSVHSVQNKVERIPVILVIFST